MYTITLRVRWRLVAFILVAALAVGIVGVLLGRAARPRVYIAGHEVTVSDLEGLAGRLSQLTTDSLALDWQGATWRFSPAELGISVSIHETMEQAIAMLRAPIWQRLRLTAFGQRMEFHLSLPVQVDADRLKDTLTAQLPAVEEPPVDARLRYGEPVGEITEDVWGRGIDWDELQRRLEVTVQSSGERIVPVPMQPLRPRVTADSLEEWQELFTFAEVTTTFDPGQEGRAHNIRLAADRIDGFVLWPGDEFSLNRATGARTLETGYREGPVIVEGELVPGIGGGVSQLASTTFNAALLAGLELTEYHNHSLPVPYLPPGRDATVWYDSLDLRFVNTTPHPVVVQAVSGHDWVRVLIRSPVQSKRHVRVETELVDEMKRAVEERFDGTLSPGERRLVESGRDGQRFLIRQIVDGEEGMVERQLEAYYPPKPEVWHVGPMP